MCHSDSRTRGLFIPGFSLLSLVLGTQMEVFIWMAKEWKVEHSIRKGTEVDWS